MTHHESGSRPTKPCETKQSEINQCETSPRTIITTPSYINYLSYVIVFLICLSASASYLFAYHRIPWVAFYSDIFALVALALAGIWCGLKGDLFKWQLSSIFLALLAIAAIPLVQLSLGMIVFYGDALVASFFLIAAAIAYSIGFSLSGALKEATFKWLAGLFFLVGLATALTGIIQWFGCDRPLVPYISPSTGAGARVAGNLNQANNYATLLVLGIFSIFYLYHKRYVSGVIAILCLSILTVACAMAQSKTSWISIAFVCGCGVFYQHKYNLNLSRRWFLFLASGFAVCVIFLPWFASYLYGGNASVIDRIAGESPRLNMWNGLLLAIAKKPLWGYGWQQVSNAQLDVASITGPMIYTEHSHNVILDLLIWNGCIFGGVILAIFTYRLFQIFVQCRTEESWYLIAIISPILIHAMLEFPLNYAYFLLPFSLALGLSLQKIDRSAIISISTKGLIPVSLVILAILGKSVHEYKMHEQIVAINQLASKGKDVSGLKLAHPNLAIFSQLAAVMKLAKLEVKRDMSDLELEHTRRAVHRFAFVSSLFRYTLVLAINRKPEESILELKRIKSIYGEKYHKQACDLFVKLESEYPELADIQYNCPQQSVNSAPQI